jgi:hypothetical protein
MPLTSKSSIFFKHRMAFTRKAEKELNILIYHRKLLRVIVITRLDKLFRLARFDEHTAKPYGCVSYE